MNRPVDDLDRMIDALNANRDPADVGPIDSETSELLDLAHGLKELGHTRWPDENFPTRAAIQLSMKLGPTSRFAVIAQGHETTVYGDDGGGDAPPPPLPSDLDQLPEPRSLRRKPRQFRHSLEIAAAVAVLVLFSGMVAVLLKHANGGPVAQTAQADGNPALGAQTQSTTASNPIPTLMPTQSSAVAPTPTMVATSAAPTAPSQVPTDNQALIALQDAAGFDLWAPGSLPEGVTLKQPDAPMSLPSFTSVVLRYVDTDDTEVLVITEASPYQDSAQTMPADVWNNAVPFTLPNGISARLYKSASDLQIWWQEGPTSIRLETGGASGTTMLTDGQLIAAAGSMQKVGEASGQSVAVPAVPGDAKVQTADQAVARAQDLLTSLGGNGDAVPINTTLSVVSAQTTLGMPQPAGVDGSQAVWSVYFKDGMTPANCEQIGSSSLCSHGEITVIMDAQSGDVLAYHGFDGAWKLP